MAEETTKKKATRKKKAVKETPAKKRKANAAARQRKLATDGDSEKKAESIKDTLRQADNKGNYSTHISDVMPVSLILAIDELDITAADGYFLGAMAAKMVNVLTVIEREHLSNLLTPLIDRLHTDHL
jgi:hypothetical protein